MIELTFIPPISWDVRRALRRYVYAANEVLDIRHKVVVKAVPRYTVTADDYQAHGAFHWGKGANPLIWIGARWDSSIKHDCPDCNRKDWLDFLVYVLCHELGHYEQYRDGKAIDERNIDRRAKRIRRELESHLGSKE